MFPIRDLNPTRIRPIVTVLIIAANIAVFFLWQPQGSGDQAEDFAYEHAAIACEITTGEPLTTEERNTESCRDTGERGAFPGKNVWLAAVVSMFLHGGLIHIGGNMWFLWIFGNNVEEAFGGGSYLVFYLATGLIATGTFVAANPESTIPLVGASGAIAGVLGAYLVLFPTHRVLTWFLFLFVPVPALIFLGIWFLGQFGIQGEGIAWEAHAGGFIAGVLITLPIRARLLRRIEHLHRPQRIFM